MGGGRRSRDTQVNGDTPPLAVNALTAATHPDPYPFYAELRARAPVYFDSGVRLWVVSTAAGVEAALTHPLCRVRPVSQPAPPALASSALGTLYTSWARTNDGEAHETPRAVVADGLDLLRPGLVESASRANSDAVTTASTWRPDGAGATRAMFEIPLRTVAALLGVPAENGMTIVACTQTLVRALSPLGSDGDRRAGASCLAALRSALVTGAGAGVDREGLLGTLRASGKRRGLEEAAVHANVIGLLVQTCEATAGLIGNTLVALGRHAKALAAVREDHRVLTPVVEEVLRFDPPVQNTRRFVAGTARVAGAAMKAGDEVLLLLAAANRDPLLNAEPDTFDWSRRGRELFSFGVGRHACPGRSLAIRVAGVALQHLIERGVDPCALAAAFQYRRSLNGRIPLFAPFSEP